MIAFGSERWRGPVVTLWLLVGSSFGGASEETGQEGGDRPVRPEGELFVGRVIALSDDSPVAGAEILLFEPWSWSSAPELGIVEREVRNELERTTSDARGLFSVRVQAFENSYVRVDAPGFARVCVLPKPGHADESTAFRVRMEPRAQLTVTVLEGAVPVPEARVSINLDSEAWEFLGGATTDSSGVARLDNLVAVRDLRLSVTRPRPPRQHSGIGPDPEFELYCDPREVRFSLEPGESRALVFVLTPHCRLEGTVRDEQGDPIPGLWLHVGRASAGSERYGSLRPMDRDAAGGFGAGLAKTDEQGRFSFSRLTPGTWWLGPTPRGLVYRSPVNDDTAPFLRRVVIPNGERSASFDLHVTRGLYLRGRVVGPEGSGVAAWVELGRGMHVRAGDDGAFELGPLEPGEFALEVRHAKGFVLPEPVRARAGEDDVEIRLELPGRISGRAIDGRSGAPVRAAVRAYRQDVEGDPRWFHRTESADDGSFRLGFVGGRTYCLQAHTADGRFGWRRDVEVGPGEDVDGCELVLRPGATLRVRHEGDPALTLVRAWIEGLPVASAELDVGEEALLVVPAAPLEVTFEELSGTRWLVRVEADANEELALAFPRRWTKP